MNSAIFFISFFFIINSYETEKKNDMPKIKRRNIIDIDSLREECIYKLVELLNLIEIKLQKYYNKDLAQVEKILCILKWVNESIAIFFHDPSSFGRREIENCLNNEYKYKTFLDTI